MATKHKCAVINFSNTNPLHVEGNDPLIKCYGETTKQGTKSPANTREFVELSSGSSLKHNYETYQLA